jgi:RNA polymerase primary sigma factor
MDLTLIVALVSTVAVTLIGGLTLDRIRGVAKRAEGQMARALQDIPDEQGRERWWEELRRILLEFEGRPIKQHRESRELILAAERLVDVYAQPVDQSFGPLGSPTMTASPAESAGRAVDLLTKKALREALENLSYLERRILELRYGLGGERPRTLDELGRTFNVTAGRIGQIEIQSLKKLQMLAEAQKLREAV